MRGLLKANLASDRARKAAQLAAGQQRKEIKGADLALEIEGLPDLRPPAALPAEYLNSLGSSRALGRIEAPSPSARPVQTGDVAIISVLAMALGLCGPSA